MITGTVVSNALELRNKKIQVVKFREDMVKHLSKTKTQSAEDNATHQNKPFYNRKWTFYIIMTAFSYGYMLETDMLLVDNPVYVLKPCILL